RHSQSALRGWRQGHRLGVTGPHAAPTGYDVPAVILPAGMGQPGQPGPLCERRGRIGVGVEEDVAMVEGGHQSDGPGSQHAVAENVPGHVTHTHDADRVHLDVDPELVEVAAYGDPGAPGGDAHGLVVVAPRSSRCEGVPQPEPVLLTEQVGEI